MNNMDKFDELCSLVKDYSLLKGDETPLLNDATRGRPMDQQNGDRNTSTSLGRSGSLVKKNSQDKKNEASSISNSYVIKKLIYQYMNPTLIPYRNFHEEYILNSFKLFIDV